MASVTKSLGMPPGGLVDNPPENLSISTFQPTDEFPRENFTFNCSLPSIVQGFYMRLFKGRDKEAICTLYRDNGQNGTENKSEFCEPIYLGDKVSFRLWNLKSHHSDTYTCCLESLSPVFNCCKAGEKHLYIQELKHQLCMRKVPTSVPASLTELKISLPDKQCQCCEASASSPPQQGWARWTEDLAQCQAASHSALIRKSAFSKMDG
ncbi:Inducible T-cell costimulator [Varanus komodoensis]|nr:Inducible T-cell costimulator [Varanus komodoensis]